MKATIDTSSDLGVESICMGMPHRGECAACLNLLPGIVSRLLFCFTLSFIGFVRSRSAQPGFVGLILALSCSLLHATPHHALYLALQQGTPIDADIGRG